MLKQATIAAAVSCTLMLSSCAKDRYDNSANRALVGAAIGATGGALAGSALGTGPVAGAAVGATAGAVLGTVIKGPILKGRQYYRDSRGYCYYLDRRGKPVYDYNVRC